MEELRKLLDSEIASEIKNLGSLKPGTDDHSIAVDSVAKLYKLRLEDDRNEKEFERRKAELEQSAKQNEMESERRKAEFEESVKQNEREFEQHKVEFEETIKQNEADNKNKDAQLEEAKFDRYFRVGSMVAITMIEMLAYGHWYKKGLKFEETGTLTSPTMKGVISKFNPFKK